MTDLTDMTSSAGTPGEGEVFGFDRRPPSPREVSFFHQGDDVDQGDTAHHHTLGDRPGQAAKGVELKRAQRALAELAERMQHGYLPMGSVRYESSGTFKKADYPGLRAVLVRAQGGGGSGAGSVASTTPGASHGAGGGGGEYAEAFILVDDLADDETVTVGAGGAAPAVGGNGNAGGTSSFGVHVVANGGAGGIAGLNTTAGIGRPGGLGGTGGTGDLLRPGEPGHNSWGMNARAYGGTGGGSVLGAGGTGAVLGSDPQTLAGNPGRGYGGGGGGGANAGTASGNVGGAGAPGVVIVELFA